MRAPTGYHQQLLYKRNVRGLWFVRGGYLPWRIYIYIVVDRHVLARSNSYRCACRTLIPGVLGLGAVIKSTNIPVELLIRG